MANLGRDLRALARLAPRPVRPDEAAAALGTEVSQVVDEGDALVQQGVLEFRDGGFAPGANAGDEEISAVRDAQLAATLADTLKARGAASADIGRLYATAGRFADARDLLAAAALEPGATLGAAADLAALALGSHEHAPGLDRTTHGRLLLIRGRHRHATGATREAMDDLEFATRWLEGLERIDALRFATIVADDLQTSQRAETFAALGEREAWAAGAPSEAGSMLTLRGRALSRIGLPREADRVLEVGLELLDQHGGENQKFNGRLNRAWVQLDRGEARSAEAGFDRLRGEAMELEGPFSQAHKDVYWARAAFAVGHAGEALQAVERTEVAAGTLGAPVLSFLGAIALAEGALYFERYEEALVAADRVLEFALSDLPVWENRARILRARALTGLGRLTDAAEESTAALAQTPEGIDGLRLRKEIEVVRLIALPKDAAWPQKAVEDLTDELLQARWNLSALELMIERSTREKDPELALSAAGLAIDLGLPTVAVRAADAARLWSDPGGQAVAFAAQGVVSHLPDTWAADWTALPHVAAALGVEVSDDQTATETLTAQWAKVVSDSGLAGYEVLSPAQRRAQGLVRRRAATSWAKRLLAVAAVVALAAGVSLGVAVATRGEPVTQVVAGSTLATTSTTTTLALEDRQLEPRTADFVGATAFGVDQARSGLVAEGIEGPATADGYYWRATTADQIVTGPVTYGRWVFVVSTDNSIHAYEMRNGNELWSYRASDAMRAAPAIAEIGGSGVAGQGGDRTIIAFGDDGGTVYFRDPLIQSGSPFWSIATEGSIVGSPLVIDPRVVVVSTRPDSAEVISLLPITREVEWTFTGMDGEPMGPVRGAPAYSNGIIYVTTTGDQGQLYLIDAETGEGICASQKLGDLAFNPVINNGVVYLTGSEGGVFALAEGSCSRIPEGRGLVYGFAGGITAAPVIVGDLMIVPNLSRMIAIDLTSTSADSYEWIFESGAIIQSTPVVAGDTVYFGNNDGVVFALAIDAATDEGEVIWRWQTGNAVVAPVAVLDGVVFVTSTDTTITAIGSGPAGTTTTTTTTPGASTTAPGATTTTPGATTTTAPETSTSTTAPSGDTTTTSDPNSDVGGFGGAQ